MEMSNFISKDFGLNAVDIPQEDYSLKDLFDKERKELVKERNEAIGKINQKNFHYGKRGALIGGTTGAVGGYLIGRRLSRKDYDPRRRFVKSLVGAGVGAGIGAGVGYGVGYQFKNKKRYQEAVNAEDAIWIGRAKDQMRRHIEIAKNAKKNCTLETVAETLRRKQAEEKQRMEEEKRRVRGHAKAFDRRRRQHSSYEPHGFDAGEEMERMRKWNKENKNRRKEANRQAARNYKSRTKSYMNSGYDTYDPPVDNTDLSEVLKSAFNGNARVGKLKR